MIADHSVCGPSLRFSPRHLHIAIPHQAEPVRGNSGPSWALRLQQEEELCVHLCLVLSSYPCLPCCGSEAGGGCTWWVWCELWADIHLARARSSCGL